MLEVNKEKGMTGNVSIANATERELVIEVLKFKYYIDMSLSYNEPHHLANYTYDLARKINIFYENEKLSELPWEEAYLKLVLLRTALLVLKTGMESLGIKPVGRI